MRDGGRLAAAIGVLGDIEARHRPAKLALKGWGLDARYAGAKDRAFVSGLVMDVLRRRRSLAWMMDDGSDRAAVLGALGFVWGWPLERIVAAAEETHGPGALNEGERARLGQPADIATAPPPVRGDYPDWLDPHMARVFGEDRAEEGAALATRAPLDLRVNTLKTDLARALKALAPFDPETPDLVAGAIRIPAPPAGERAAAVETAPEFERGWFEVQDLGSQWAATMAGEIKGRQVLDLCAGGGGKTLALAAAMANTGQLYAYDSDARRLTDTVRRAQRAGVRNLQVRSPIHPDALAGLEGRMDLVFVDAPCTGSGTWRRHPDTKWRVTPEQLAKRTAEQDAVLGEAVTFAKPGGRIVYVTCSLLAEENEDRVAAVIYNNSCVSLTFQRRLTLRIDGCDAFFAADLLKS
jgi:16S rRNA (cytosine967-C5)-methyltransferase